MEATVPPPPARSPLSESSIERAVRHAVYLTGGLVLLAFSITELASAASLLAQCYSTPNGCLGENLAVLAGPELGAGLALLVIAIVLIVLAHEARRSSG